LSEIFFGEKDLMFYALNENVYFVSGKVRGCIYDFNSAKLYNLNADLTEKFKLINAGKISTDLLDDELKKVLQKFIEWKILFFSEKPVMRQIEEIKLPVFEEAIKNIAENPEVGQVKTGDLSEIYVYRQFYYFADRIYNILNLLLGDKYDADSAGILTADIIQSAKTTLYIKKNYPSRGGFFLL